MFGITPIGNGVSAGMDFFMPKFKPFDKYSNKERKQIIDAFCKSYGICEDDLYEVWQELSINVSAIYGPEKFEKNDLNILQLYLCYDPYDRTTIDDFVDLILVFDDNWTPGIWCNTNDYIKVNSGIKVALDHDKINIRDDGKIYCGDKLTQLIVLPVKHTEPVEITEEEYDKLMGDSERGSNGFGSSDVKH